MDFVAFALFTTLLAFLVKSHWSKSIPLHWSKRPHICFQVYTIFTQAIWQAISQAYHSNLYHLYTAAIQNRLSQKKAFIAIISTTDLIIENDNSQTRYTNHSDSLQMPTARIRSRLKWRRWMYIQWPPTLHNHKISIKAVFFPSGEWIL